MTLRPLRALTILLLFAAAYPPPEMAKFLLQIAHGHHTGPAKNTRHARGRHRVVSSTRAMTCLLSARIALSPGRTTRPSHPSLRWFNSIARSINSSVPTLRAWPSPHLRC